MRLWSLHPSFLDSKGLVALWREALLAQHVLHGRTKGYTYHPQLHRFRSCSSPTGGIAAYLVSVQQEAFRRGYSFDSTKIMSRPVCCLMTVTTGQLQFEGEHLKKKLEIRDPHQLSRIKDIPVAAHPLFSIVSGTMEEWERA